MYSERVVSDRPCHARCSDPSVVTPTPVELCERVGEKTQCFLAGPPARA
jgi:hypothetical protein